MDTSKFTKETYDLLLEAVKNLPNEAVETTKKETTRKGYDTTGFQYQYLVNVLNEVLTPAGWTFKYSIIKETEGKWQNGRSFYDITVNVTMNILGCVRSCAGGHRSEIHADALKGAITNAFKKTVAFYGVGKKAYEGTLDEDYQPIPVENVKTPARYSNPSPSPVVQGSACGKCGAPMKVSKTGSNYCSALCWKNKQEPTISYDDPNKVVPF